MESLTLAYIVVACAVIYYWVFTGRKGNYPPGPRGYPIIGNLLQIPSDLCTHITFTNWAKRYGPIFSLKLFKIRCVVLSDAKLIRDTFNNPAVSGRPTNKVFKAVSGGNYGVLAVDGQNWAEQRRFTLRHLRDFGFGKNQMETLILDEAKEIIENFKADEGKSITLERRFNLAILNSLWIIVTGTRLNHDDLELNSILEDFFKQLDEVFVKGIISFIPELTTIALDWMECLESCDKNLLAIIGDLFAAGAETTSTTMDWSVLFLAGHPKVQKKFQREVDEVIGQSRLPSLSDRANMPYTEAVMMEILRKSSIAALGFFHTTLQDVKISGFDISKGTFIIPNFHHVHHDPKNWNKPNEFNPNRFLSSDRKIVIKNDALMPFSVGKRVCLGESLARDEFFLFLTSIFQRFDIELDPKKPKVSLEPQNTFICKPQEYHVIIHDRHGK